MAPVGSRKRSRSRSRSRGRGSEKRRKKSSKDVRGSCSASRSHGRKASTTSSGPEGEAAGSGKVSWAGFLGTVAGKQSGAVVRRVQSAAWVSGLKDTPGPGTGPAR